ncbi:MAG: tripartite tricarboxylate transporter substrate binding protein [Rhodospirillaceae bacterium]
MRKRIAAIFAVLAACVAVPAQAQQFPSRPVRLVVPYPPGGANDIVARLITPTMSEHLGANFIVDNRGGGATIIGSEIVAKAAPDGYTILIIAAGHAANPSLYPKLPYDTARDFAPVALIGDGAYVLVAHPTLGVASAAELISLAKAKPGEITYASSSTGNLTHLAAELFSSLAGVKMLHVPYKGGGPAMTDLLGGRVGLFFSTVAVARPHIQAGRIKALGVTTAKRTMALPSVPTIAEAGLPGYEASGWYGLAAPAKTPAPVIAKLHEAVQAATRPEATREKLLASGVEAADMSSEQFGRRILADIAKWEKVIKPLGIRTD